MNKGSVKNFILGRLRHWRFIAVMLMVYDVIAIHLSYFFALWFRFDLVFSQIPEDYLHSYYYIITAYSVVSVVIFWFFRMYRGMWRYASHVEFIRTFAGSVTASVLHSVCITLIFMRMPASYYIWGAILQFGFLVVPRFAYRLLP